MQFRKYWPSWCLLFIWNFFGASNGAGENDYNVLNRDGSYQFGYDTPDSYHYADANRNNVVKGEFGGRNPATGGIDSTVYTAGPRGYRPRGRNIARKYDLNQNGPRPIGSIDDPYYDPLEDPSYHFHFRTRTYSRQEDANRAGDVTGKYTYLDDVGERHNVEFIAGKNTGFHVKTPFPDSNPGAYGPLYFRGRGKPIPRGRTSIQRGLDGSYKFVSAGPDQRRTETSDATGHVRGSYTYLDDKGVQHSVHYIAGPETGYRVLKNVKGPHLPTVFPFGRPDIIPPDFYDYIKDPGDVFDLAATEHGKPLNTNNLDTSRPGGSPTKDDSPTFSGGLDVGKDDFDKIGNDLGKPSFGDRIPVGGNRPTKRPNRPTYDYDDAGGGGGGGGDFGDDLFGGVASNKGSQRPGGSPIGSPSVGEGSDEGSVFGGGPKDSGSSGDDGSYKPSGDDGSYKPGLSHDLPRPTGDLGAGLNDYDDDSSSGLFGSQSNSRPPRPPTVQAPPILHVGVPAGANVAGTGSCEQCKGTIVTNVGDKLFSVPPGVSVRAHVQSIDLLPLVAKVPSPSEQMTADISIKTEQLNSAASNDIVRSSTSTTSSTAEAEETKTSTKATTPEPAASEATTPAKTSVTTTAVPTTTLDSTTQQDDDGGIF